jgi:hypothetical protein
VPEFDSKVKVEIDSDYYKKDANTNAYTPIVAGSSQYSSYGGVTAVSNV